MKTINGLTDLENKVLDYICRELATWREDEPSYSCVGGEDVTTEFKWNPKVTSGVVSSLFKKGYLADGYEDGTTLCVVWEKIPNDFGRVGSPRLELTDEQREYPTPQKDGLLTRYQDGTVLCGGWNTRLTEWKELNLHRIQKGY